MAIYCSQCGTNGGANRFCGNCGFALNTTNTARPMAEEHAFAGAGQAASQGSAATAPVQTATMASPADAVQEPQSTGSNIMQLGRVDVAMMTLLSTVTLGIWWLVWAFQEIKIYRRISGRTGPNLEQYFWAYVIALGSGFVLSMVFLPLGILASIASIVIGAMFLHQWTQDRDAIAQRYGTSAPLASGGSLIALWIVAQILTLTFVGIIIALPLLVVLSVMIFNSHNRVVEGVESGGLRWA